MGNSCQPKEVEISAEATPTKQKNSLNSTNGGKTPSERINEAFPRNLKKNNLFQMPSRIHSPSPLLATQVKKLNTLSQNARLMVKSLPKFDFEKSRESYLQARIQRSETNSFSSISLEEEKENKSPSSASTTVELGPYQYKSDKSTYRGGYKHGKREGIGVSVTSEGDIYQGSWIDDHPEGYGRYIQFNGDYYLGEFREGYPNGKGKLVYFQTKIIFEGNTKRGKKHGEGVEIYPDGSKYKGKK